MLGIIFTNLVEMIETTVSYEMADEILEEANLSSKGVFTAVGHYPLEDVVEIVTLLSQKTRIEPDALIFAFGKYLFAKLMDGHKHIVSSDATLFDLLAQLDSNIRLEAEAVYDFYLAICAASHNMVLLHLGRSMSALLTDNIEQNLTMLAKRVDVGEKVTSYRKKLLDSIMTGLPEKAWAASHRHLVFIEETLLKLSEENSRMERSLRRMQRR